MVPLQVIPGASLVQEIAQGAVTVFGWLFWFDVIILLVHYIEHRLHPTPGGRASALGSLYDRAKGMLLAILGIYLTVFLIATAINQLAAATGASASIGMGTLAYDFFIQPIVNGLKFLFGAT